MKSRQVNEKDMEMVDKVGSMIEEIMLEQLDNTNDAVYVAAVVIAHMMANSTLPEEKMAEFVKATAGNIINHYRYFKSQKRTQLN